MAVPPAPPFADRTASVFAVRVPAALASTSTETVQLPPTGRLPPLSTTARDPARAVTVPPHAPSSPFGVATASPAGRAASSATPVSGTVLPAGFVIVSASTATSPARTFAGANAAATPGGATTANAPPGSSRAVAAASWRSSPS